MYGLVVACPLRLAGGDRATGPMTANLDLSTKKKWNIPENFPEISETKIYISSVFPGNTAEDIEKLITTPLEDKLKSVSNVVEIISTSQEDYSIITVEFDENIEVDKAKQKVKDEIAQETAGEDWPTFNGAKVTPNVAAFAKKTTHTSSLRIKVETPI